VHCKIGFWLALASSTLAERSIHTVKAVIRFTFCNVTTDGEVGGLSTVVVGGMGIFQGRLLSLI